jgi:hypothetical protein
MITCARRNRNPFARGYNPIMPFAPNTSPTLETYQELQRAYDHFNAGLFDAGLPFCLINHAERQGTLGYFSAERFARHTGETSDEITMNPAFSDFTPSGINVLAPHFHAATGAPSRPLPGHP